jgi:hypothetical protein
MSDPDHIIIRKKDGKFAKGTSSGNKFKKGNVPWNKGMKGFRPSVGTEFKGDLIGSKHPSWKGGIQIISNDVVYVWTGPNQRARRSRKIYEDNFGPIPKGYVIYHVDGDSHNDDPKNLIAISRAELLKRNRNEK